MTTTRMHPPPLAVAFNPPSPDALVDLEALELLCCQDQEGLRKLYDRHHQGLYRYLRATLSRPDAEEVLQDVFLTAFHKSKSFAGRASVASWLYGIARNLARNAQRQVQRRERRETPLELDLPAQDARAEAFEEVLAAVRALPQHERQTVELVYLGELSLQEAAQVIGVPLGTIKSRLHNARKHLQTRLGQVGYGPQGKDQQNE